MADATRWRAVVSRDASFDGTFVYCVRTTKIYCRPVCKSRLARRSNVEFCETATHAESNGYRACKRCQPQLCHAFQPEVEKINKVCRMLHALPPDATLPGLDSMSSEAGLSKHHFHRQFKRQTGMTPREYALAIRDESSTTPTLTTTTSQSPASSAATPNKIRDKFDDFVTCGCDEPASATITPRPQPSQCHFTTIETTYGLLLIAFHDQQVCKLELCSDELEVHDVLSKKFPPEMYRHQLLDLVDGYDTQLYQPQIDTVVEALERPSGKVLDMAWSITDLPSSPQTARWNQDRAICHRSPPTTAMSSHITISPAILYWGTPVVLVTTVNEDGSANIGPISSAFWLGNRCMLGLESNSQTTINLRRTGQCVLNLPSDDMVAPVNALARTTGTEVVPEIKISLGYRYEKDKFKVAGLTQQESELVRPRRIQECPAQMEAELAGVHEMMSSLPGEAKGFTLAIEVRILRTHVVPALRLGGHENRVDPDAWRPMIMNFQHLYGLKAGKPEKSTLANIEEELYRLPAEELST
ncbi:hypothetical protein LTR53_008833 [Teratosphaeriaceae sp. CCFEE 6253]|nr:hypothetical protein LTR53_008833 [Teratosphaeriaceae sp. CCFEE 6253]